MNQHLMANHHLHPVRVKIEPSEAGAQNEVREHPLTEELIEVIDLTNEEEEFQSFVQTQPRPPQPLPAKPSAPRPCSVVSGSTGAPVRYKFFSLPVPIDYIQKIQLYEGFDGGALFGMRFKQLIMYGRITQKRMKDDVTFIFQLDDGTGQVNVMFRNKKGKKIDTLNKLNECEEIVLRKQKSAYPESLHKPLKTLLAMARANCGRQTSQPVLGRGCYVIGFPFQSPNGGVTVYAHTVVTDTEDGKPTDLFWKSYLYTFYQPIVGNDRIDGNGDDSMNSFKSWLDSQAL